MSRGRNYDVGYGQPPASGRFRKGRSGNPGGRPRGRINLQAIIERTLAKELPSSDDGEGNPLTVVEAVVRSLAAKSARGDIKAAKLLLDEARRQGVGVEGPPADEEISGDDQAIIDAYVARLLDEGEA